MPFPETRNRLIERIRINKKSGFSCLFNENIDKTNLRKQSSQNNRLGYFGVILSGVHCKALPTITDIA